MMEVAMVQAVFMDVLFWNRARINFLSNFLVALVKVRTVNLVEIATAFSGRAKKDSKYRRIKRFFQSFELPDRFNQGCIHHRVPDHPTASDSGGDLGDRDGSDELETGKGDDQCPDAGHCAARDRVSALMDAAMQNRQFEHH